jgi:hypothetical protein
MFNNVDIWCISDNWKSFIRLTHSWTYCSWHFQLMWNAYNKILKVVSFLWKLGGYTAHAQLCGHIPGKEGGMQVLAGLAPSSQTELSLLRSPGWPRLQEKMIYLEMYIIFTESLMYVCWFLPTLFGSHRWIVLHWNNSILRPQELVGLYHETFHDHHSFSTLEY